MFYEDAGSSSAYAPKSKRRKFVGNFGLLTASLAVIASRQAAAQEKFQRNIQSLQAIASFALQVQSKLVDQATQPLGGATPSESAEFASLQQEHGAAFIKAASLPSTQQINYVSGAQIDLALALQNNNISIIPAEVTVINFGTLTFYNESVQRDNEPAPEKSLTGVIWAIFCDTIGINNSSRALFDGVLKRFPDALKILDGLVEAVKSRDTALVALRVEQLASTIFNGELLTAIEAAIGQEAIQKVLRTISMRFVPLIGWALFAASFLVAIKNNWSDIRPFL